MFKLLFIVAPVFIFGVMILTFLLIFNPKVRGKMMSNQVKAMKYMVDDSADDIESISNNMANATKGGVETTTRAIKNGFSSSSRVYCKHCGGTIDTDSHFCKHCGKEQ